MKGKAKIIGEILHSFDKGVQDTERRIKERLGVTQSEILPYGMYIFPYSVDEEDTNFERLATYLKTHRMVLKEPLWDVLGGYMTNDRTVYPIEWVKILMDAAYMAGQSAEKERIKKHLGEVPQ